MISIETDAVADLTRALRAYLDELEQYRLIWERHAAGVIVRDTGRDLLLHATFPDGRIATLRQHSRRLPGWDSSPFHPTESARWESLRQAAHRRVAPRGVADTEVIAGIHWQNQAILVEARADGEGVVVELTVLALPTPLPDLPLRVIARALNCLEYLLPGSVAAPVPVIPAGHLTLPEYLRRATPEIFSFSKRFCVPHRGR